MDRRDFLNGTLLGAGACLLGGAAPIDLFAQSADWDGFGGVGDYRNSHGDSWRVMTDGHQLRDHAVGSDAIDTGEAYDCAIVGGGISGLAAALFLQRQAKPGQTCLVLDIHPIFGGLAKRNEFLVDGQRTIANQASAMFFPPLPGTFLADFYNSIGITEWQFPYQKWTGADRELPLGQTSYADGGANFGLWFGPRFGSQKGTWVIDPWGKKLEAPRSRSRRGANCWPCTRLIGRDCMGSPKSMAMRCRGDWIASRWKRI
jgi:spermidine dehydrogenase